MNPFDFINLPDRDVCVTSMLKILAELELSPTVIDLQNNQVIVSVEGQGPQGWIGIGAHSYSVGDSNDSTWSGDDPLTALVELHKVLTA